MLISPAINSVMNNIHFYFISIFASRDIYSKIAHPEKCKYFFVLSYKILYIYIFYILLENNLLRSTYYETFDWKIFIECLRN